MLQISLAAEPIGHLFGVPITNGLLTTWVGMGVAVTLSFLATRNLSVVPSKGQLAAEMVVGGLHSVFTSVLHERVKQFFPLLATLFIFILSLNWVGLLPGVGTIGIHEIKEGQNLFVPLFRSGTADLNTTIALALIVMVIIQIVGFRTLGAGYMKKFINTSSPIYFFVGILELVSEFSKIISFAFRLFGNIFAGEVLLTVIAFLVPLIAPIPFLGLELFVGVIQALVFSMLTSVFLLNASEAHEGH